MIRRPGYIEARKSRVRHYHRVSWIYIKRTCGEPRSRQLASFRTIMSFSLNWTVAVPIALGVVIALKRLSTRKRVPLYPTPPQPPGWPILGNIGQMPKGFAWLKFIEWGKELNSDIIYTTVIGQHFLIINSFDKAIELLDTRSGIYSSRPPSIMVDELMEWGHILSRVPYGDVWREQRRVFRRHLRPANADWMYRPKIINHARRSMIQFQRRPNDSENVLRHTIGGLALSLAYGFETHPYDDPTVKLAEEAIEGFISAAGLPGSVMVNIFPFLKHVPTWFPGAGFKREALKQRANSRAFRELPFKAARAHIALGQSPNISLTSLALEDLSNPGTRKNTAAIDLIKDIASVVFAAGSDTTGTGLRFWIRTLMIHPEIQRRIQKELDTVLEGRLPDFEDKKRLPWLRASLLESMRLNPVTPTALPHKMNSDSDDIFDGFFIPRGTTVIANVWAMLHDEEQYPDPMSYKPERFIKDGGINPDVLDPNRMTFGFGRRECPGSHIADDTIFIIAGTILSIFDICKPLDEHGEPIEPDLSISPGSVSHPVPYGAVFKVRNDAARSILEGLEAAYPNQL